MNSGQICIAVKRIYVHESIYDEFRQALVGFTKGIKVGDGFEPGVFMGPIQNKMQYERVKGFIADIEKEKWTVACGGTVNTSSTGYFLNPTIIDNPADDSRIVVEEPFGQLCRYVCLCRVIRKMLTVMQVPLYQLCHGQMRTR